MCKCVFILLCCFVPKQQIKLYRIDFSQHSSVNDKILQSAKDNQPSEGGSTISATENDI